MNKESVESRPNPKSRVPLSRLSAQEMAKPTSPTLESAPAIRAVIAKEPWIFDRYSGEYCIRDASRDFLGRASSVYDVLA